MKKLFTDIILNIAYFLRSLNALSSTRRFTYKDVSCVKRINILGTGPSLKDVASNFFTPHKNEVFFALNDFGTSELYNKIQPEYYILLDPSYWKPEEQCNERDFELRENLFDRMNNETTWAVNLFVPWKAIKLGFFKDKIHNPNIKITAINYQNFHPSYSLFYRFILKNNLGVVPVGNVLGGALYIAINLGFKEICVYGAEHSWTMDLRVNNNNQVCTIKKHFFEDSEKLEPWRKTNKEIFKMSEVLKMLYHHFYGYEYLAWYAKSVNCKVYNCTKGSFIDSFERK